VNQHPRVSVVVVNYRGAQDTIRCLQGFDAVDWPAESLELVVVDNASGDDSVELIRQAVPRAKVVASETNTGFAGGCNRGVAEATGEVIAFLNSDARPDEGFLREAVAVLEHDSTVGCVASKVLDWEGKTVDFVDAAMSWYGQAYKVHVGQPDQPAFDVARDVLFASGAAMVLRRDLFEAVGGFDERYFMFFEDVDLGWRLWLLGYRVRYVPASKAFHRHHASMSGIGAWREQFLLERNALMTLYKNYDDDNLTAMLPGAMALAVRRGVALGGDDSSALDLAHPGVMPDEPGRLEVSKTTLASAYAVDDFTRQLPSLSRTRAELQERRKRPDTEIIRLFRTPLRPNIDDPAFVEAHEQIVEQFGIRKRFSGRQKIVVATGDTLTAKMAGPAIRAWQIALALSEEHDVELVTTIALCTVSHPRFTVRSVTSAELRELEQWCDVLVFQGFLMHEHPFLRSSKKIIVADIYDPFHLEQLEQARDHGEQVRREVVRASTVVLNEQLLRGDFFTCASGKQRDFWLGQMSALGRINPVTYDDDETLESLITTVPFGVTDQLPVKTRPALKGVVPGIGFDDKVILWGGGIYNWFDPLTLIEAVGQLSKVRPDVRLFFMGLKHPNPNVPEMRMAMAARILSEKLGLTDQFVFFNEDWVAYDDRQNYLMEADIGVSTHLDHVETAFSFRTRILDYLWCSLPIVTTQGDALAALVEAEHLGITVPAGDVDALASALGTLLDDTELAALCRKNIEAVAPRYRWNVVLQPLVDFCREPRRAPDLMDAELSEGLLRPLEILPNAWGGVRADIGLLRAYVREGGVRLVVEKVGGRLRKLVR